MGGKRHKGVGYNRAKKKKPSPLVPAAEVTSEVEESESEQEPEPEPEPEPQPALAPAPEPAPQPVTSSGGDHFQRHLPWARSRMLAAKKEYEKAERRWERNFRTYFNYDKYSPYNSQSVVARIKERLQRADDELDEARSAYVWHRTVWLRLRSWLRFRDSDVLRFKKK